MDKQTSGEPPRDLELRSLGKYSPDIRTLKSVKMPTFHFGMLAQAFSLGILGRLSSNPFAAYPGFSMTYFAENGRREEKRRPEEGQTSGAVYSPVLNMNFQFILNQLEQEKASWQNEERSTQRQQRDQDADFHREPQRAGETENVRERQENTREFVDHEVRLKRIEEIERIERIIQGAVRMQSGLASSEEDAEFHSSLVQSPQQRAVEQMRRLYEKNMPQVLRRNEYLNELHYLQDGKREELTIPGGTEEVHRNILRDVVEGIAAAQVRTMPIATLLYQTETERFHKVDNAQRVEEMRRLYEKNMPQTLQRSEYLNELRYLQDSKNEEIVVPSGREELHRNLLRDVVENITAAQIRTMPVQTLLYQTETERFHKLDNAQRLRAMRDIYEKNMPQTLRHSEYLNELKYLQDSKGEEIQIPGGVKEVHQNLLRDIVENVTAAQIRTMPIQTLLYQTEEERFRKVDNAQRLKEMRDIYEKNMPQTLRQEESLHELRYLQDSRNVEVEVPSGTEEVHQNLLRDVVESVTAAQIRAMPIQTLLYQTEEERFRKVDNAQRLKEMRDIYEKNMPQTFRRDEYLNELQYLRDARNVEIEVPSGTEEVRQNLLRDVVEGIATAQIRSLPLNTVLYQTEEERLHKVDNAQRMEEMRRIYEKNMPQTLRRDEYSNELRYLQDSKREEIETPSGTEEVHQNLLRDIVEGIATTQMRSLPLDTVLYQTEEERLHKADNAQRMEEMRHIYEKNMPQTLRRDEYSNELRYLQDSKGEEIEVPRGREEIHRNLIRDVVEGIATAQMRSLPLDTILHQTEEERFRNMDDARRKAEMRQIYEKNMPQTLRRDEYINELRYRSGRERVEEVEIPSGTEDVYRNIVKEIIEETEHTDLIQKLIRREPRVEDMHEVSVLKRFGAPKPVLLQDEAPVETPVDVIYARKREKEESSQKAEESIDSSVFDAPPIQTDWDSDVPQWARDFFDQLPADVQQDPEKVERARIYRRLREKLANRDISSSFHWEDPEARVVQYGDPDFLPPQDLQYKQVKYEEPQKAQPVETYLSESEIRRAAERVYHILEERIREERRRMGL